MQGDERHVADDHGEDPERIAILISFREPGRIDSVPFLAPTHNRRSVLPMRPLHASLASLAVIAGLLLAPVAASAGPTRFSDSFSDGTLDAQYSTYGTVTETNGEARLSFPSGSYSGLYTDNQERVVSEGTRIAWEIGTLPTLSENTYGFTADFSLDASPLKIQLAGNGADNAFLLQVRTKPGGAQVGAAHTYNPVAHRWIALRFSNGTVAVQVSPDGATWTTLYSQADTTTVGTMQHIQVDAGDWGSVFAGSDFVGISSMAWDGLNYAAWADATFRPYSSASPFNTPAAGQSVHPNSAAIVQALLGQRPSLPVGHLAAGHAGTAGDFGKPVYRATAHDPIYTLDATDYGGASPIDGLQVRVPEWAVPAAGFDTSGGDGGDHHMTVVSADLQWEYDLFRVQSLPAGGGTLTFGWGGRLPYTGNGIGIGQGAGTAAHFGNMAGLIRAAELRAGRIDHALFATSERVASDASFGYGAAQGGSNGGYFVAPALSSDRGGTTPNLPPMGAWLRLNMTTSEINALAVPSWKKTILKALAEFGCYIGDTGGGGFGFQLESGQEYLAQGLPEPMAVYGAEVGVPIYQGKYVFNMNSDVDWAGKLQVLVPPGY